MKKRLLLAAFLLVMSFCFVSGVGYGESGKESAEKLVEEFKSLFEFKSNVFRDIEWGTLIEKCEGMLLIAGDDEAKLYKKRGNKLKKIGTSPLEAKYYIFFDQQLMAIMFETRGEGNFEALKEVAFEEFESWIQSDASVPDWVCFDFFDKTMRELKYEEASQKGSLCLASIEIYNEFKGTQKSFPKAESEPEWSHVASWKGNGIKTTESFRVKKAWRIKWKNLGAILQVYVYNLNGGLVALPVNTLEEGEDISHVYETGEFYLTINAMGKWEVRIEEKT